jgi:hypothetical protein
VFSAYARLLSAAAVGSNHSPRATPDALSFSTIGASPSGKRARLTAQSPVFSYHPVSMTNVSMPMRLATSISWSMRVAFIESR